MGRWSDGAKMQGSSERMWKLYEDNERMSVKHERGLDTHFDDYGDKTLSLVHSHHLSCTRRSGENQTQKDDGRTILEDGRGRLLESRGPGLDGPALLRNHLPVDAPRKMW